MELMSSDEQQELIDLLRQLPEIEYPHVRFLLVATLPSDIKDNIHLGISVKSDIASIVDTVSSDAYAEWEFRVGQYPILVVIKNALGNVGGGPLAVKLHNKMVLLRAKFKLDPEESVALEFPPLEGDENPNPSLASDQFLKELYNFIQKLDELRIQLEGIRRATNRYLRKQKCLTVQARLTIICTPVHEFTAALRQSKEAKIINYCTSLKIALASFENQAMKAERNMSQFCEDYGTKMEEEQPSEERRKLQKDVENLMKCCDPVLEAAKNLYDLLSHHYIGQ